MYCNFCGKEIDNDSRFCCYCGKKIPIYHIRTFSFNVAGVTFNNDDRYKQTKNNF